MRKALNVRDKKTPKYGRNDRIRPEAGIEVWTVKQTNANDLTTY